VAHNEIREEYKYFSEGAHPNRTLVPYLFLGEGNKFTLGSIPPIDPFVLGEHVRHLLQLCYWYVGIFAYFFREPVVPRTGIHFEAEFRMLTPRLARLRKVLTENLSKLHEEIQRQPLPEGIGPAFLHDNDSSGRH